MGYEISLGMAWEELEKLGLPAQCSLTLLGDAYLISQADKEILLLPSGLQADEPVSVLILRYLIGRSRKGYSPSGEWISFKETAGGKIFWPNYCKRVITPLAECFQQNPAGLIKNLQENFAGRMLEAADIAVEVETFPGVLVRILFWEGDEGIPAEATILFDRALTEVFIMEDIDVLLAHLAEKALHEKQKTF